jgi:FMN phosphatase YigB (HAD superfamily)
MDVLGVGPHETWMVGDNLEWEIVATPTARHLRDLARRSATALWAWCIAASCSLRQRKRISVIAPKRVRPSSFRRGQSLAARYAYGL